jgi:hypothetical protein
LTFTINRIVRGLFHYPLGLAVLPYRGVTVDLYDRCSLLLSVSTALRKLGIFIKRLILIIFVLIILLIIDFLNDFFDLLFKFFFILLIL